MHACIYCQCVENYNGECFGGGCELNPMPEPSETDANDNDETTHEDNQ